MRVILILGIIFLLSCDSGKLNIDKPYIDLGDVKPNSIHEKFLYLRNFSSSTISVDSIIAGCTCTEVQLERESVTPHDSTEVYLWFKSRSRSGEMIKSFTLISDSGERVKTTIRCNVLSRF